MGQIYTPLDDLRLLRIRTPRRTFLSRFFFLWSPDSTLEILSQGVDCPPPLMPNIA